MGSYNSPPSRAKTPASYPTPGTSGLKGRRFFWNHWPLVRPRGLQWPTQAPTHTWEVSPVLQPCWLSRGCSALHQAPEKCIAGVGGEQALRAVASILVAVSLWLCENARPSPGTHTEEGVGKPAPLCEPRTIPRRVQPRGPGSLPPLCLAGSDPDGKSDQAPSSCYIGFMPAVLAKCTMGPFITHKISA